MENNAFWLILQRMRTPLLVIIVTYAIAILGMVIIPGMDDNGQVYHLTFFDAFYFVSYMASTIGFGESPYAFTYEQKIWVSFCIYLTVVGWFYGLGSLVSVLSDKTLTRELMRGRFKKRVQSLNGPFIIVLGYSSITAEIINKLYHARINTVVIDKDEERINHFLLESISLDTPVMVGDALVTDNLIDAGVLLPNCQAIVSLFTNEEKNLRASVLTRFLNPNVKVIAKSTHPEISTSILDTDIAEVINPFAIFAKRLDISLSSPHVFVLENWIYGNSDLSDRAIFLPEGKYVVCGYGRFGKKLHESFCKHELPYVFIDEKRHAPREMVANETFIRANPDDKEVLIAAGIKDAAVLIVGTKNDIENLSIVITAKKLNPNIFIIARENTMDEVSIFQAADIDWIFIIERIMVNKTSLAITHPLLHYFINIILHQDEVWANALTQLLKVKIGDNPELYSFTINEEECYALYHELKRGLPVTINMLQNSLSNWRVQNNSLPLLIKRANQDILLPQNNQLEIGDEILFACDEMSREELELIASNIYELHYAKCGEEKSVGLLGKLF